MKNRRLILTTCEICYEIVEIEREVPHLDFKLKSNSPFADFSIAIEGIIDDIGNVNSHSIPELLREIANRIEEGTEYEIKSWK